VSSLDKTKMRLLLISSSNVHGFGYLDQPEPFMREFLGQRRIVAFVPFAAHDHDAYTAKVRTRLGSMGLDVVPVTEIERADAIFVGGGNTFRLLKTLHERNLLDDLRRRVGSGLSYIGSSAGSMLSSPTIRTTNDMPIVEPPSLDALGLIPFQLNCHYLDPDPSSTHKGETREQRLLEFHEENATPVVGLREGTCLRVDDHAATLVGGRPARIFRRGERPFEVEPGTRIDEILR
jgi:dipeptidase E